MTLQNLFELDEQLERFEDRIDPLNASEQTEYRTLKAEFIAAEIAYYANGHKPSSYSVVTMLADKRRDDVPAATYHNPMIF